ncbi:hypothetical protein CASFOL_004304 [Castilleja foliolosa]|uniref:RING-type E3 ubiquitin transferase n=1 Tax=Castilleja foliolosa TaxID=1961234 RepID=A0ABD3EAP5_9LAMI
MENRSASENLLDTARSIFETVSTTKQVLIQKHNFDKFSSFLDETAIFLQNLSKSESMNPDSVNSSLENLKTEIRSSNHLALECTNGNKMYLFLSCKRILEDLENNTKNINKLCEIMSDGPTELPTSDVKYEVSELEEKILQKIEKGIEDRNIDRSFASEVLASIAQFVGISNEHNVIKTEFENFKNVINSIESRTEASRMEQIISLLSDADIITTPREKEIKYFTKRNSLGWQLLEALPSFYCPITADVMDDPVETSSGHTFERAAIMRWLEGGNNVCPLTKMPLSKVGLRPNKTLRQSIEEWRNRNIMISIALMKPELQSNDEEEVMGSLVKLRDLCKSSEVHREWIVMEEYVPIIAGLVCEKNGEMRMHALAVLCCLAKDGDDNKERIANVNNSITYIVRSLARKVEESVLALQLLLELSRSLYVRELIGGVQGCILLLVTLANSDDAQASKYAEEVLDNLAFLDENVVQMAKSKFFKPLLQRLCEGPLSMQTVMAEALADVELTDHNKLSLSKDGAIKPLLKMLDQPDIDIKSASVRALENLSGVTQNGLQLIKEGAKAPLFDLLFCHTLSSSSAKLREHVAKTIMHMAESTASPEAFEERVVLIESEDDVFKLFSLISYSGPDMQETLLLTFRALCGSSCGLNIRTNLQQICAVKVLVQLCELDDLPAVRQNAVKLLYLLTQDGDHETFTQHITNKCITTLVKIIETSDGPTETSKAMGIISNLPHNPQISDPNVLKAISDCLTFKNPHSSHEKELLEYSAQALIRFTVPTNIESQLKVAELDLIPVLVKLLSIGSPLTKRNICVSLKQFSENSRGLSLPIKQPRFLGCCFASSENDKCIVHSGICSVETSFCLLEANAVKPLVRVLGENDDEACEASLDTLLTLIDGVQLQNGCKVIEEAEGVIAITKMLNSSCTNLQEKALGALQRIFRIVEFKTKYGKSAQIPLVDITQRGSRDAKSMAAKILAQLNVLNEQSSFF